MRFYCRSESLQSEFPGDVDWHQLEDHEERLRAKCRQALQTALGLAGSLQEAAARKNPWNGGAVERLEGLMRVTWSDGRRYVGEWAADMPEGQGELTLTTGGTYIGQFQDGQMHGVGVLRAPQRDSEMSQIAKMSTSGSSSSLQTPMRGLQEARGFVAYRGQFRCDQKHGFGTEEFADGTRYEGSFHQGKMKGGGKVILPSGLVRRLR